MNLEGGDNLVHSPGTCSPQERERERDGETEKERERERANWL